MNSSLFFYYLLLFIVLSFNSMNRKTEDSYAHCKIIVMITVKILQIDHEINATIMEVNFTLCGY